MKLHLKVVLVGKKSLRISLIHVCEEAMKDRYSTDIKLYTHPYTDIKIWSNDIFFFDEKGIRLPEHGMILTNLTHLHEFESDDERYHTLRKFYYTLIDWSKNTKRFPNTDTSVKIRVRIHDTYWIVI
jgi:hypothetical protein